ncbi:MAG: hypothetical protein JWP08_1954 [Bryobacterales bacterium]|nr:hypothetical protein [Bryobacterales bacterium]
MARVVHENPPNDLGTQRKEVRAVFTPEAARANQPKICFVCQSGGLKSVAGRTSSKVLPCDLPHFRVNHGYQLVERPPGCLRSRPPAMW